MTLVVCWRDNQSLTVVADTKISAEGLVTYTDGGPKIFQVPITAYAIEEEKIRRRTYPSMGFAYAGSTLIAQSVLAMASTCLQNLSGDIDRLGPSMLEVADLFLKCATQYTKEMLFWRPKQYPGFEALIFGFCPKLGDYLVYHLMTTIDGEMVNMRHEGHYAVVGSAFSIGSGVEEFRRIFEDYKVRGEAITAFENFELVLTGCKVPSVGGSRQYATATSQGVDLVPVMIPVEGEDFGCRIEVLGCDVLRLGPVGDYSIAHKVMGPHPNNPMR